MHITTVAADAVLVYYIHINTCNEYLVRWKRRIGLFPIHLGV